MSKKWIRRKRNSHGFGVQSPNDYHFVQHVLRERLPYYAYEQLERMGEVVQGQCLPDRINKLLFRLTDYVHPHIILEVGAGSALSACSMMLARPLGGRCITISNKNIVLPMQASHQIEVQKGDEMVLFRQILQGLPTIELLHIAHTPYYKECVECALPYVSDTTLFIIEGICDSVEKARWWRSMQESPLTGISYDIGSVGLLFFDKARHKDTYWVNLRD